MKKWLIGLISFILIIGLGFIILIDTVKNINVSKLEDKLHLEVTHNDESSTVDLGNNINFYYIFNSSVEHTIDDIVVEDVIEFGHEKDEQIIVVLTKIDLFGNIKTVRRTITVPASIIKNQIYYNVTFENNEESSEESILEGKLVKKPKDPTKEGYLKVGI